LKHQKLLILILMFQCPSALISSLILLWQETSKLFFTTKKRGALYSFLKNSISGTRKDCLIRGHPYFSSAWGQIYPYLTRPFNLVWVIKLTSFWIW
jgi:hypothetical protein